MIRRPPRSTRKESSAASDVYKRQVLLSAGIPLEAIGILIVIDKPLDTFRTAVNVEGDMIGALVTQNYLNKKESII